MAGSAQRASVVCTGATAATTREALQTRRASRSFDEREERTNVFRSLCAQRCPGVTYNALTGQFVGEAQLTNDGTLLIPAGAGNATLQVEVSSYSAVYRFVRDAADKNAPQRLERFADRKQVRIRVCQRVSLRFEHPELGGPPLECEVLDFSVRGFAFALDPKQPALKINTILPRLEVRWKGGTCPWFEAEVRYCRRNVQGECWRVGVRLTGPKRSLDEWYGMVAQLLYPNTHAGGVGAEALWQLYARSGYFQLSGKSLSSFSHELPTFSAVQALLEEAPEIGASFSAGSIENPVASCHQVQVWPGSWLFFHLCRSPRDRSLSDSDDRVLIDLYARAYGFVETHPDTRWLVSYTQAKAGLTRALHYRHVEHASDGTNACAVAAEVIEIRGVRAEGWSPRVEVAEASADEARLMRRSLARTSPTAYVAATGLAHDTLDISPLSVQWRRAGLERRRDLLVARRDGRLAAGAILDFTSPGTHLYGLLDQVRLVRLSSEADECFDALLAIAHAHYQAANRTKFVYLRMLEAPPVGPALLTNSLGITHINVFHIDLLGDFMEHVYLTLSRNLHQSSRHHFDSFERNS
jgi:hypothetical protein